MKISEMLLLIKAGYSKKEINALIEAEQTEPEPQPEPEPEPQPEPEPEPDYKALYEQAVMDLEKAQKANVNQPQPDIPPLDIDAELLKFANKNL